MATYRCPTSIRVNDAWTTGSATSYTITWTEWVEQSISTSVTSATNATVSWSAWNGYFARVIQHEYEPARLLAPPETPEARRAREEREVRARAEHQERLRQAEARTALAKGRATRLLESMLTPAQRRQLAEKNYVECRSQSGRRYRIHRYTHGNLKRLDDRGREVESLCVQPDGVPTEDAMLAQLLMLQSDEDGLRRTANISVLHH